MTERIAIPIDQAIRAAERAWESRNTRTLPYQEVLGNPMGSGHHDCPVNACETWRQSAASLDSHLVTDHGAVDDRDVARLNRAEKSHVNELPAPKTREAPLTHQERVARQTEKLREQIARVRAAREAHEVALEAAGGGQ